MRIYDIFFDYNVLLSTDGFIRDVSEREEFQRPMSTAEYHYLLGGYMLEREKTWARDTTRCSPPRTSSRSRSTPARRATAPSG